MLTEERLSELWLLLPAVGNPQKLRGLPPEKLEEILEGSAELLGELCRVMGGYPMDFMVEKRRRILHAELSALSPEKLQEMLAETVQRRMRRGVAKDSFPDPEEDIIIEILREWGEKINVDFARVPASC